MRELNIWKIGQCYIVNYIRQSIGSSQWVHTYLPNPFYACRHSGDQPTFQQPRSLFNIIHRHGRGGGRRRRHTSYATAAGAFPPAAAALPPAAAALPPAAGALPPAAAALPPAPVALLPAAAAFLQAAAGLLAAAVFQPLWLP